MKYEVRRCFQRAWGWIVCHVGWLNPTTRWCRYCERYEHRHRSFGYHMERLKSYVVCFGRRVNEVLVPTMAQAAEAFRSLAETLADLDLDEMRLIEGWEEGRSGWKG